MPQKKSTSGKKAASKNTKKQENTSARSSAHVENGSGFARQVGPYLLAVGGLLLAVCLLAGDGIIGGGIQKLFCGLFGVVAYTLPLYFFLMAFLWRNDIESGLFRWKILSSFVILCATAQLAHIFDHGLDTFLPAELFASGVSLHGGGVIGGWLGVLFLRGFGKVCTLIFAIGLSLTLLLFLFGVTPRGLMVMVLYKIRVTREKVMERAAMRKQQAAEMPRGGGLAERNRIREEEYTAWLREKRQREKEARMAEQAQPMYTEPVAPAQLKMPTPEPTVYKVRKHKIVDIPLDPEPEQAYTEPVQEPFYNDPEPTQENTANAEALGGTVDDRIFDEVMRRTRERVERSARTADNAVPVEAEQVPAAVNSTAKTQTVPDKIGVLQVDTETGEVLSEMAIEPQEAPETDEDVPWYEEPGDVPHTQTETLAPTAKATPKEPKQTSADTNAPAEEELDLSGLFVNPEDAELLDRLSDAYLKKEDKPSALDVNREIMASGQESIATTPAMEVPPPYNFPPIEILTEDDQNEPTGIKEELQDNAVKLVETLKSFHVNTKIENISRGPTITRYELKPEMGTKVRSIANLVDDIALNLATTGVRIEAPIPGKAAVGIEVPNKKQSTVHLRTLIQSEAFTNAKSKLTCCLGEDVAGEAVYFDIAKMPHLLIAGATGMGKSVCINSLVVSLLYKASPDEVKLILVDPKKVEMSIYNGIPHLLVPVVSDPKKAAGSLSWAVAEMERRFGLIEAVGVRDVKNFNEKTKDDPDYEFLPQIVIIIDELADLMMTAPDDVEESICRLAQKARAAGMHLIIGTQRPSVDVITGLIKANIPSRIAFTVASQIDSRTIIDRGGAENLIGRGDMLFYPVGAAKPMRVQGAFVSESDVEEVVAYIRNMNKRSASYSDEVLEQIEAEAAKCGVGKKGSKAAVDGDMDAGDDDPMLRQALELAVESGKISTSLIQRRLQLGYGRAAKLIDRMEQMGYVSPPDGQRPRKVLITKQEFMEMVLQNEVD